MAVVGGPAAFMSYVRFNDQHDDGQLSQFRERLAAEVRAQTGQGFAIFQDRYDIAWGQNWQQRIDEALDAVTLLLVIITPSLFHSPACRAEFHRFLDRERALGRADLILPVYYISAQELDEPALRESDEMARVLSSRQFADWRELRFEPFTSPLVRRTIAQLASRMRDTFWQPSAIPADSSRQAQAAGSPAESADNINLTTVQILLAEMYPDRKSPTRQQLSELVGEILSAGYCTIAELREDLNRAADAALRYEQKHRPNTPAGEARRFAQVGIVRQELGILGRGKGIDFSWRRYRRYLK